MCGSGSQQLMFAAERMPARCLARRCSRSACRLLTASSWVKLTTTGVRPARMIMRARVLLESDHNAGPVPDRAVIAQRVGTSTNTVRAIAKRFAETDGDVLATIGRKPRETPPVAPIVTGEVEARLIALACSTPPEGYSRWSLRLLESHVALVEDLPDLD